MLQAVQAQSTFNAGRPLCRTSAFVQPTACETGSMLIPILFLLLLSTLSLYCFFVSRSAHGVWWT